MAKSRSERKKRRANSHSGIIILPFRRECVTADPQEWAEAEKPMNVLPRGSFCFFTFNILEAKMKKILNSETDKTTEVKIGNTTYIVSSVKAQFTKQAVKTKIERLIKNAAVKKS